MTALSHHAAAQTRTGILMMLGAVFFFTAMDAVAKGLIETYPLVMVIWARFAVMLVIVALILRGRTAGLLATRHPFLHFWRCALQFATVFLFFASLAHIGLVEAQALTDINPLLITLGAVVFLGEALTRARMVSVIVALLGALIILRPGLGVFSAAALLPLAAAVTYAGSTLITRLLGQRESPWTAMIYASVFGTLCCGVLLPFHLVPVAGGDLWRFVLLGALGTGAQLLIIRAFSLAEASVIAPFGYAGLVTAAFWGIVLFGHYPDEWTVVGAVVIAGAGLYVWRQETRAADGQ